MPRYLIILEPTKNGWRASCPGLTIEATGATRKRAREAVKAKLRQYLKSLVVDGLNLPQDRRSTDYFQITRRQLQRQLTIQDNLS